MSIGTQLRTLRYKRGLKIEDVAEALGASKSHLSLTERDKCDTRVGYLLRLCHFYRTDPNTILEWEKCSEHHADSE